MSEQTQTTDGWVRIPRQPGDPQPRISDGHYRGIRIDEVGDFWGLPRQPRVLLEDLAVQLATKRWGPLTCQRCGYDQSECTCIGGYAAPNQTTILDDELAVAASMLRRHGWTVVPPPPAKLPGPAVGQTWASPKPRVEPRTITRIGYNSHWPWAVDDCIYFTTPSGRGACLSPEAWGQWVKKAEARPV